MLIKDIPFKAVKEMALDEQFKDYKIKDEDCTLFLAFNWNVTKLGVVFWMCIYFEKYDEARKIWDWDKEVQNDK